MTMDPYTASLAEKGHHFGAPQPVQRTFTPTMADDKRPFWRGPAIPFDHHNATIILKRPTMATEPAAGVWRDARTQRIREEESHGTMWIIELNDRLGMIRTGTYSWSYSGFVINGQVWGYERIVRYARINT